MYYKRERSGEIERDGERKRDLNGEEILGNMDGKIDGERKRDWEEEP